MTKLALILRRNRLGDVHRRSWILAPGEDDGHRRCRSSGSPIPAIPVLLRGVVSHSCFDQRAKRQGVQPLGGGIGLYIDHPLSGLRLTWAVATSQGRVVGVFGLDFPKAAISGRRPGTVNEDGDDGHEQGSQERCSPGHLGTARLAGCRAGLWRELTPQRPRKFLTCADSPGVGYLGKV